MIVKIVGYSELSALKSMQKECVEFRHKQGTKYLGAYNDDGEIIGCVGWMMVGSNIRYKTDYVLPEWRNKGVYTLLWREREYLCAGQSPKTTAFCTDKSIGMYIANGFKVARTGKIKFVIRHNK